MQDFLTSLCGILSPRKMELGRDTFTSAKFATNALARAGSYFQFIRDLSCLRDSFRRCSEASEKWARVTGSANEHPSR